MAEFTCTHKRNDKLENKFKDLKIKLEEIEKQSKSVFLVTAEKEEVENELAEMKTKHQVQERRIGNIVKSLELIENQNALNSQNLANVMSENLELKSALDVLKAQNEHMKAKEISLEEEVGEAKLNVTDCQNKFGKICQKLYQKTDCLFFQWTWSPLTATASQRLAS